MDRLVRTDSLNDDFIALVKVLDHELWQRYGDEQQFYSHFNTIDTLKHVVVAYRNSIAVGCGAIRKYDNESIEVKRMFVRLDYRSSGVASRILNELEKWAVELGFFSSILETGNLQPEAIHLYKKKGYEIIPNYGQYAMVKRSICMIKMIQ